MSKSLLAATALLCTTTAAYAGGIHRTGQSVNAIFEEGRYLEFSFGAVSPDISGSGSAAIGGGSSGDMAPSFFQFGAAYKADIDDQWSYAIIYDQPFGADIDYPSGSGYFAQGSTAELDANAITGIIRYKMPSNVSFHGGLRLQSLEASANIPFVTAGPGAPNPGAPYNVTGDRDFGVGYLLGAAYERPDIALRVSLTYNSKIKHSLDTTENSALASPNESVTEIETPQSLNLEFQTGVAEDTLLFGGLRWTDWDEFSISPVDYGILTGGGSLVSYADDVYNWQIGVGRRLNDTWSVSAAVDYEKSNGGFQSNLNPTDGLLGLTLAAIYTNDNMKVTTGIRYIKIGDAETRAGPVAPAGDFQDNDAIAFGIKVGYSF